jgi:hypothetical protein
MSSHVRPDHLSSPWIGRHLADYHTLADFGPLDAVDSSVGPDGSTEGHFE